MARVSSSSTGPANLPQLVERLHAVGPAAVADFSQDELETVIDDLPLALESESIRDHLPALVGRIDRRLERTFRRMIEIARQDEERVALLLLSLRELKWDGTPTEDEFAWIVQQMSRSLDPAARLAAFQRAASLTLHEAQVAILDALGSTSMDQAIRAADAIRREAAALPGAEEPAEMTEELVRQQEAQRQQEMAPVIPETLFEEPHVGRNPLGDDEVTPEPGDDGFEATQAENENDPTATTDPGPVPPEAALADDAPVDDVPSTEEPSRDEAVIEEPVPESAEAVFDESAAPADTWNQAPEVLPDRLTVRTLLRSLEPATNLAGANVPAPSETNGNGNGAETHPEDEPTVADDDEPTPHVENSLTGEGDAAPVVDDESSSPEAAAAAAAPTPPLRKDPITVRTLLASLDSVMLSNAPDEEAATEAAPVEESPEVWNESEQPPERVTVMTMLRSLETVRVKMAALEDTPPVASPDAAGTATVTEAATGAAAQADPNRPKADPKPWSDVDLKPLSPPDRARRLQKARRALETPELKRGYLAWLFDREKDTFSIVSVRKEILEFGFERPIFLGFDDATRAKLGRWIRERCAADQIAPPAVLAALRRATWIEGEPPQVDEKTRAIVDAATGSLSRVPSEERAALFNRDFTAWLFSIREWEDREVLDRYARDPLQGVSEGLFRALAAMDGLSARFGGTGGQSALDIALGVWDRADNEARSALGNAISEGWSRGLVLDRRSFFDAFWSRYQQHEAQRPAILVAIASFDVEIEEAHAKAAKASAPPTAKSDVTRPSIRNPDFDPPPVSPAPLAPKKPSGFAPPPTEPLPPEKKSVPPKPPEETESEEGTDRFFRMMRKNMEAGMRASAPEPTPTPEADDFADAPVPEEGDAFTEGVVEDELIPEPPPTAAAAATNPSAIVAGAPPVATPTGAGSIPDSRDDEKVLPSEPLRSLSEYTRFLKSLSAGRPIDELLSNHGMDYKQYAACMTAWGRLLQNRPDLALRMGQLLRAAT